jgi:hypothetical protein
MTFTNEGFPDRTIRILVALVFGYIAWFTWPGVAALSFLILGVIALATGVAGWCPLYAAFGCSTVGKKTAG